MAESAALNGFAVWSLDAFGDLDQHPGVRTVSLPRDVGVPFSVDAVVRAAERIEADVVAYLSPFENHPAAVECLARGRTLWGNDASVLRHVRQPERRLSDVLQRYWTNFAKTGNPNGPGLPAWPRAGTNGGYLEVLPDAAVVTRSAFRKRQCDAFRQVVEAEPIYAR